MAHVHEHLVPKAALIAGGAMMALTVALTAAGVTGLYETPKARFAETRAAMPVVKSAHLILQNQVDGTILVTDADTGAPVRTVAADEGGFIHYSMTGLEYSRKSHALDSNVNIRIERHADGRLMVRELDTGVLIDVIGYGPTNAASFAGLLDGGPLPPVPGRVAP